MCIQWGTVGEWAGAIGSTFVAVVAIYIARREGRRAEELAEFIEAGRVHVSVFENPTGLFGGVSNGTNAPLFDVTCQPGPEWDESKGTTIATRLPPGSQATYNVLCDGWSLPSVVVRFRTLSGTRWETYPDRTPQPVPAPARTKPWWRKWRG